MAIIISQGSGATVATESISGQHYGYNKITDASLGGSATVGMVVDSGAGASGAAHVFLRGNVTISDPKGFIGLVSVGGGLMGLAGNVTLSDPKTFIGSVSVGGLVDSKGFIGLVTTQAADPKGFIGLVTVGAVLGNVTLSDPKTFIGSVSVGGIVDSKGYIGLVTTTIGTAWPDPKTFVGLVTVGGIGTLTLADPKGFVGLVTIGGISTMTLADPKGFIGLVTVGGGLLNDKYGSTTAFTITLASLANSVAGVGRQSNVVTSNIARSALIGVKFTVGTTPVANTLIYVYLLRGDGTITDDNAGASDAGITIVNAPLLGTILCSAATSNVAYYGMFDTKFLGSLGSSFGIAVVNSTNVTANSTGGNFAAEYTLIT